MSILILNETIYVELIVFLAIFADLATIAIAYDTASYSQRPVEWQMPKIWIISVILGKLSFFSRGEFILFYYNWIRLFRSSFGCRNVGFTSDAFYFPWRYCPELWEVSFMHGPLRGIHLIHLFIHSLINSVQEVLFLEVALTENWLIFITRTGKASPANKVFAMKTEFPEI